MKTLWTALVTAAALVAVEGVWAQAGARPRPTDVAPGDVVTLIVPSELQGYNDYAAPAHRYASRRAVVHYVVVGVDAPPLNDDDGGGVPDYVERVGAAADTAITYYERRGFAAILPDAGGPDARPDIYISRFAPGSFGAAFPAADARGGAFVVVSNTLDPSAGSSLGSLYGTVAHELFHLVQFSYFQPADNPVIPSWALEGSAAAIESRVYPELDDLVSWLQLRHWFARPQRSLTAQSYGAQLFWRFLDEREPRVLPAYLERLASSRSGTAAAALAATYERVTGRLFAPAFGRFASWVARQFPARITPLQRLGAGDRKKDHVAPLAIHFLRLPHATRSVRITVPRGRGLVELQYELESDVAGNASLTRRLSGRTVNRTLTYTIPKWLRRNARLGTVTLLVANGDPSRAVAYSIVLD